MSKDIRSFFSVTSKKKLTAPNPSESPVVKRKAMQISSDEEVSDQKQKDKDKHQKVSKKRRVLDSDDEDAPKHVEKRPNLSKLKKNIEKKEEAKKVVDISSVLGGNPTRVERAKPKKKPEPSAAECVINSDDEFEKTVIDLDESVLVEDLVNGKETKESTSRSPAKKETSKENGSSVSKVEKISPAKSETASKAPTEKETPKRKKLSKILDDAQPSKVEHSPAVTPKTKSAKKADLDASVLSDEERQERKRMAAILYQKYKNRQGVINPGSKEVPKGKPNCLSGLSFLITGILESLERDEAAQLIKDHGGKVSSTVGKRLNYMVVGEEAGPKKIATAEELGITMLTEDQLFDLIREKSGSSKTDSQKLAKTSPKLKEEKKDVKKITPEKRKHEYEFVAPKRNKVEKIEIKQEIKPKREPIPEDKKPDIKVENAKQSSSVSQADLDETLPWVERYKPASIKQIIGQQGPASNCNKLLNWLSKWYENHDGKKKLQKPNPWAKNDDGSFYKAALLSGPPGVGKTTTASLVTKELGFDTVEFNASDTRSKKLLKEEVSELLSNKSLYGYFHGDSKRVSKKHVLIMDEVDGMAGNEDRGGIQELIALIKDSSVPIICMCNDRNHQKMRSLVNYCYDLRFNKPSVAQIKGPIMSICFKEKIKIPPAKLEEIIAATNNDIRQTLNHLSLISAGKDLNLDEEKNSTAKKDLKLGPWEVIRKVFSADLQKGMTIHDKSDLFFHDYSLNPLFVQQNYLIVSPHVPKPQVIEQVALTADSLSLGDLVDKRIRSSSAWSLLPTQAMFSSVLPGEYMSGHFTGQINFPGWLGKNSKSGKRSRMAQEIHDHTRLRTSGSRLSVRLDYASFLLNAIVRPLKKGLDGVEESLNIIKEYRLLREDIESLIELTSWPGRKNPMDGVDSKVKAALTRAYNKEVLAYSYSAAAGVKKKKTEADAELEVLNEGEEDAVQVSDEEDDDKLENDALIKAKKKAAAKAPAKTTAKTAAKPSTSKAPPAKGKGKPKK